MRLGAGRRITTAIGFSFATAGSGCPADSIPGSPPTSIGYISAATAGDGDRAVRMIVRATLLPICRTVLSFRPATTRAAFPAWTGAMTARSPAKLAAADSLSTRQRLLTATEGLAAARSPVTMEPHRELLPAHRLLPAFPLPVFPANPEPREMVKVLRANGLILVRAAVPAMRALPRGLSMIRRSAAL